MSVAAFTNALARSITRRLSRAIANKDMVEVKQLVKILSDPKKLQDDVIRINEKHKGSQLDIDKEIDIKYPDVEGTYSGRQVVEGLKKMGTDTEGSTPGKNAETGGFEPHTLKEIGDHNIFTPEIISISKLARNDPLSDSWHNQPIRTLPDGAPEATVPPIVDSNGVLRDGHNRVNQAALDFAQGRGDGTVSILRGSSVFKENANEVVLDRVGSFVTNLKKKVDLDFGGTMDEATGIVTKIAKLKTEYKGTEHTEELSSFAAALHKGTNKSNPDILNDELYVGFAMDILRAARDNKGGAPGKKLKELDPKGRERVTSAKINNELAKDIGLAADARMTSAGGTPLKPNEIRHLGAMLLEFGRGNFGENIAIGKEAIKPTGPVSRPSLLKEYKGNIETKPGEYKNKKITTTSDFFDHWVKRTGHNGREWLNLYPNRRSLKAPSPKYHGPWVADAEGNIIKAPTGVEITGYLAGGKGNTSLTKFGVEAINILGKQKIGVDLNKFEYWRHLGAAGKLNDTGLDKTSLEIALQKAQLSEEEMVYLTRYWDDLRLLKKQFMDEEDALRLRDGNKPKLTPLERESFQGLRPSLKKRWWYRDPKTHEISGEKVDLQKLVGKDKYGDSDKVFLDLIQNVHFAAGEIRPLQTVQRARFNRIREEVNERLRLDPNGEVYIPYMLDYRTRVYPIDKSGANHLTGGTARFMWAFPKSQAKPIVYNDEAFHVLVDDLLRFETKPITQTLVRSGEELGMAQTARAKEALSASKELRETIRYGLDKLHSNDLQRWKYWKITEKEYLRRGNELLDFTEKSLDKALTIAKRQELWDSYNPKWLKGIKDHGEYLSALTEIARVERAFRRSQEKPISYYNIKPEIDPATGNPIPAGAHMSTSPIELDASASGSQHLYAQYRNIDGLKNVNVWSKRPPRELLTTKDIKMLEEGVDNNSIAKDLYTNTAGTYTTKLRARLDELSTTDPKLAKIYNDLTNQYVQVGRSTSKPIVMKVPYGAGETRLKVTLQSLLGDKERLQILRDYNGKVDNVTTLPDEFMDFHWKSMWSALKESLDTQFEFRRFSKVLMEVYNGAPLSGTPRKALLVKSPSGHQTDFTIYATQFEQSRERVKVNLLPDFPQIKQSKGLTKSGKKKEAYAKKDIVLTSEIPIAPTDPLAIRMASTPAAIRKGISSADLEVWAVENKMVHEEPFVTDSMKSMASALAPNAVHMVDAGYLTKLVIALNEAGVPVYVVHDAFFIMAPDVRKTKEIAGKVFIEMHNGYNLRKELIEGVAKATGISFDEVVERVNERMLNPNKREMGRGILSYPDGALGTKTEGPLEPPAGFSGLNEVIMGG